MQSEDGRGDFCAYSLRSIGCKELRRQSFSATRLLGASEVRNGSEFSNGKMVVECGVSNNAIQSVSQMAVVEQSANLSS